MRMISRLWQELWQKIFNKSSAKKTFAELYFLHGLLSFSAFFAPHCTHRRFPQDKNESCPCEKLDPIKTDQIISVELREQLLLVHYIHSPLGR